MDAVSLPESFYVRSAPALATFGAVPRILPVNTEGRVASDPAAAWFDAATVVSVLDTVFDLVKG